MIVKLSNANAETSVININTTEELAKIGVDPSYPADGSYKLTSNITIDESWESKVTSAAPFTGKFDGNNKTINYSMKLDPTSSPINNWKKVIFAVVKNATFQNINLVVDTVNMRSTFAYYAINSTFTNINISGKMISPDQMSGFVEMTKSGAYFKNVKSSVNFTMKNLDFTKYYVIVGGIVSQVSTDNGDTAYTFNQGDKNKYAAVFEDSSYTGTFTTDFTGAVTGARYYYLGGLFGATAYASPAEYFGVKIINSTSNAKYNYTGTLPADVNQFYYVDSSNKLQATYDKTNVGASSKPIDELKSIGRVHQNIHLELVKDDYTWTTYGYYGDDNKADAEDGAPNWSTISAPSLVSVATAKGKNTGKITGLDKNLVYEYKLKTESNYTTVSNKEEITGLAAGIYTIRVKDNNAKITEIEVKSTTAPIINIETPKPSELMNAIDTGVAGFSAEAKAALENNNATLNVEINNIEISDTTNKTEIEQLKSKISKDDQIATIFDIDLTLKYGNKSQSISELTTAQTFTINIPEALQNKDYEFYLVNNHNGVINKIAGVVSKDGKTFTFTTDKFSLYALAYNTEKSGEVVFPVDTSKDATKEKNPNTFDNVLLYVGIGIISLFGIVGSGIYLKKNKLN